MSKIETPLTQKLYLYHLCLQSFISEVEQIETISNNNKKHLNPVDCSLTYYYTHVQYFCIVFFSKSTLFAAIAPDIVYKLTYPIISISTVFCSLSIIYLVILRFSHILTEQ